MQSFLAYRRFGKLVKRQLERDTQKAEALARGNNTAQCSNSENRLPTSSPLQEEEEEGNREIITQEGKVQVQGHRRSSIETDSSITAVPGNGHGNGNGNLAEDGFTDSRDVEKGEYAPTPASTGEVDEKQYGETEGDGDGDEIVEDLERRSTHKTTRSFGTAMGITMTGIEVRQLTREMTRTRSRSRTLNKTQTTKKLERKEERRQKEEQEEKETVFVVGYESSTDPMDPHNWPYTTRILATSLIASIGFIVGFASAIDSAVLKQASTSFHVSPVAESLATGIFLIGFGIGALFAGPISETVGRNPVYIITIFIYMCWILGAALAPNLATQLVMRFLAGFFGSTPLVCAGGSISDLWDPFERVFAFPAFANAAFMGPIFGPVVGGFIGQSTLVSWRWTEWITLILSGVILVAVFLFQPETYAPILLKWKAKQLRKLTGDERYVSPVEIRADTFTKRLLLALYRPFILTFKEPIVMLFSLYLTVIYIILFTFLDGYTYIFGDTYGFSEGITGLAFIGIAIGLCFASLLVPLIHYWAKRDLLKLQETQGDAAKLPPEFRLWFAMLGAPAIPISLFWMGWTTYPHISYWSPLISSVVFGYGILCIFISTYQYIIDSYEVYAASALAGVTFIRYVASGGMVEVGIPFYENLGVHWTLTILGAISAVIAPVPYAFFKWGPTIRKHSKYAAGMKGLD